MNLPVHTGLTLAALAVTASLVGAQTPTVNTTALTGASSDTSRVSVGSFPRVFIGSVGALQPLLLDQVAMGKPDAGALGEVWLANTGGFADLITPSQTTGTLGSTPGANDDFGASVAGVHYDLLDDGFQVAVGAPRRRGGSGMVQVFNADSTLSNTALRATLQSPNNLPELLFGARVTNVGDLDGDGHEEFAVSSNQQIRVYNSASIKAQGAAADQALDATNAAILVATHGDGVTVNDAMMGQGIISPAVGVGDVNGDNLDDYAYVAQKGQPSDVAQRYVIFRTDSEFARPSVQLPMPGEYWLAGGADIDRDSLPDVAVLYRNAAQQCTVYTILSSTGYTLSAPVATIAGAGDIELVDSDDDLFADVAVGSATQGVQFLQWQPGTGTLAPSSTLTGSAPGFGQDIASLGFGVTRGYYTMAVGASNDSTTTRVDVDAGNPSSVYENYFGTPTVCPGTGVVRPTLDVEGAASTTQSDIRFVMNNAFPGGIAQVYLVVTLNNPLPLASQCYLLPPASSIPLTPMAIQSNGTAAFTPFPNTGIQGNIVLQVLAVDGVSQAATTPAVLLSIQ